MEWLQQVLEGSPDAAAIEHLRRGFTTWLNSATRGRRDFDGKIQRARPLSLARCLSLPESPERVRTAQRDAYLREIVDLLPTDECHPWKRATALSDEVRHFARHQWLCWIDLDAPPHYASEINRLLWLAMRAGGGRLPQTARQYAIILKS
jgi:hypothetical protein